MDLLRLWPHTFELLFIIELKFSVEITPDAAPRTFNKNKLTCIAGLNFSNSGFAFSIRYPLPSFPHFAGEKSYAQRNINLKRSFENNNEHGFVNILIHEPIIDDKDVEVFTYSSGTIMNSLGI